MKPSIYNQNIETELIGLHELVSLDIVLTHFKTSHYS